MNICQTIESLQSILGSHRLARRKIAFVPTMGNLHEGHLGLIRLAKEHADDVVVSIFVNPLQFGPKEDYLNYPRTLDQDLDKLKPMGIDVLFYPSPAVIYPQGQNALARIHIRPLENWYCGQSRPNFFSGVATVIVKLFNIVRPDVAVFGEKDYQQLKIIQNVVRDLCLNVDILSLPTCREQDGLAMSSRNGYLSAKERARACELFKTLGVMKSNIHQQRDAIEQSLENGKKRLLSLGFSVDYIAFCDAETLKQATKKSLVPGGNVILAAVFLGKTRLIDNIRL